MTAKANPTSRKSHKATCFMSHSWRKHPQSDDNACWCSLNRRTNKAATGWRHRKTFTSGQELKGHCRGRDTWIHFHLRRLVGNLHPRLSITWTWVTWEVQSKHFTLFLSWSTETHGSGGSTSMGFNEWGDGWSASTKTWNYTKNCNQRLSFSKFRNSWLWKMSKYFNVVLSVFQFVYIDLCH